MQNERMTEQRVVLRLTEQGHILPCSKNFNCDTLFKWQSKLPLVLVSQLSIFFIMIMWLFLFAFLSARGIKGKNELAIAFPSLGSTVPWYRLHPLTGVSVPCSCPHWDMREDITCKRRSLLFSCLICFRVDSSQLLSSASWKKAIWLQCPLAPSQPNLFLCSIFHLVLHFFSTSFFLPSISHALSRNLPISRVSVEGFAGKGYFLLHTWNIFDWPDLAAVAQSVLCCSCFWMKGPVFSKLQWRSSPLCLSRDKE